MPDTHPPGGGAATRVARRIPDLTSGPVAPTLLMFALPLLGSNILQSMNGTANAIWVSHSLGEAALTATSNANQVFFLMLGAAFGAAMAANIMIAQAIGARDEAQAKRVVGTATAFFLVLSVVVGSVGAALTPAILDLMGTPPDARPQAVAYLRVIFAALPFIYLFTFLMMAQRATGDSRTPFWFSLLNVALDVTLNPLLILGIGPLPRLGVAGSATATLLAQSLTLAAMLWLLHRRRSLLVLRRSEWRLLLPDLRIVTALVGKGAPMALQMMIMSLAAVSMMSLVNAYGSHTAAAYGAALQLWTYVQMPGMALSGAVSSMAAQNVGAGRMDRVERVALIGAGFAVLLTALPVVLIQALGPLPLMLFLPASSPSLPIAAHLNGYVLWSFIPFVIAFVLAGVARATGAVWPPLIAMVAGLWGLRVPFANLLRPSLGADAIWISFPVSSSAICLFAIAYYRFGGWRRARMLDTRPHGDVADTGMAPPSGVEETEIAQAAAEALSDPGRSTPRTPASEVRGGGDRSTRG